MALDWRINEIEFLQNIVHKITLKTCVSHFPLNILPICFQEINSLHFFLNILFIKYF